MFRGCRSFWWVLIRIVSSSSVAYGESIWRKLPRLQCFRSDLFCDLVRNYGASSAQFQNHRTRLRYDYLEVGIFFCESIRGGREMCQEGHSFQQSRLSISLSELQNSHLEKIKNGSKLDQWLSHRQWHASCFIMGSSGIHFGKWRAGLNR